MKHPLLFSSMEVTQGWGNYTGKSGHGLINILTFDTGLAKLVSYMFYYDNKNNTGLTNKILLLPALLHPSSCYPLLYP